MKIEQFENKLGEWLAFFADFLVSKDCDDIYKVLKADAQTSKIIPVAKEVFQPFLDCKPTDLKLIVIGNEPFMNNKKFLEGIAEEEDVKLTGEFSTEHLGQQGVLVANRSLTAIEGVKNKYVGLWDKFWEYFFTKLQTKYTHIPVLFLGKKSLELEKYITEYPKYELPHPNIFKNTTWNTNKTFTTINGYLRTHKDFAITWNYSIWLEQQEELKELEYTKDKLGVEKYNKLKRVLYLKDSSGLPF